MTKNRRQKKNEQQTCSAMEIIAGFLLLAGFAAQLISRCNFLGRVFQIPFVHDVQERHKFARFMVVMLPVGSHEKCKFFINLQGDFNAFGEQTF